MRDGGYSSRPRHDDDDACAAVSRGASSQRPPRGASGLRFTSITTAGRDRPPRDMLYVKKHVPLADFARDVGSKVVERYPKLPPHEKRQRFGSTIVPIFVPLTSGETEDQYETRFVKWVERKHGYTLRQLENSSDEKKERFYRMRFATANARGIVKFDPREFDGERRDDLDERNTPSNHTESESRRRDHHERSRSRSPAWSISSSGSHDHHHNHERRDDRYERTAVSPTRSTSSSGSKEPPRYSHHPTTWERVPREALYVKKYVELEQYKADFMARRIGNYVKLPDDKKQELFGSTIMPIHVPLARGESERQYEGRFIEWIRGEGYNSLHDVETHVDEMLERYLRIKFAKLNAKGMVKFSAPQSKRERAQSDDSLRPTKKIARADDESKESKEASSQSDESQRQEHLKTHERLQTSAARRDCSFTEPPEGATTVVVAKAYIACGCRPCLVKGMRFLTGKVAGLASGNACETCLTNSFESGAVFQQGVVDLTQDEEPQSPKQNDSNRFAAAIAKLVTSNTIVDELSQQFATMASPLAGDGVNLSNDPVEKQLLADAARQYHGDSAETTRLHEETQALRKVIKQDLDHRNAALAMAIVHMWRHKNDDLERRLGSELTKNVLHVQRASHEKCSSLASDIADTQSKLDAVKQQLDEAMTVTATNEEPGKQLASLTHLGQMLTKTELKLRGLVGQQRQQFSTLLECDQQLRLLVKTLLSKSS